MSDLQRRLERVAAHAEQTKDQPLRHRGRPPKAQGEVGQVYSVRIPVAKISELEALAAACRTAPRAMIREWVLQRLEAELGEGRAPGSKRKRGARGET